jgi:hypothetical protein
MVAWIEALQYDAEKPVMGLAPLYRAKAEPKVRVPLLLLLLPLLLRCRCRCAAPRRARPRARCAQRHCCPALPRSWERSLICQSTRTASGTPARTSSSACGWWEACPPTLCGHVSAARRGRGSRERGSRERRACTGAWRVAGAARARLQGQHWRPRRGGGARAASPRAPAAPARRPAGPARSSRRAVRGHGAAAVRRGCAAATGAALAAARPQDTCRAGSLRRSCQALQARSSCRRAATALLLRRPRSSAVRDSAAHPHVQRMLCAPRVALQWGRDPPARGLPHAPHAHHRALPRPAACWLAAVQCRTPRRQRSTTCASTPATRPCRCVGVCARVCVGHTASCQLADDTSWVQRRPRHQCACVSADDVPQHDCCGRARCAWWTAAVRARSLSQTCCRTSAAAAGATAT